MSLMDTLLKNIEWAKISAGLDAVEVKEQVDLAKASLVERQKADEVENTQNTGKGKELAGDGQLRKVIDMAKEYSALLPFLPGFQGTGLDSSESVSVTGEIGLFRGNSEAKNKTDYRGAIGLTTNLATGKVTITQGEFRNDILISYKLLNHSVIDLYDKYMVEIAKSMAKTIDAYIINADGALTSNINSIGTTFVEADREIYYFLQGGVNSAGLRKKGLANAVDFGTLSEDDFLDLSDKLGGFANKTNDVLILQQRKTQNLLLKLPTFKTASVNGTESTVRTGAISNIWGYDIFLNENVPLLAKADGTVSETGAENTTGQTLMFYTPAVQYGFGQELRIDTAIEPGKWVWIVPYFEFGFAIVSGEAETDKTVASGVNITY